MKNSQCTSTCAACGEVFKTTRGFDKHRVGSYGEPIYQNKQLAGYTPSERRCLSVEEMFAKGMVKNVSGLWITAAREDAHEVVG